MPYPNEHSCRLRDPGDFQPNHWGRINRGGVSVIIGRLKGKTASTSQAIRYPKAEWTMEKARAHCEKHGGRFEAAKE